jgi:hypothetical protein
MVCWRHNTEHLKAFSLKGNCKVPFIANVKLSFESSLDMQSQINDNRVIIGAIAQLYPPWFFDVPFI